MMALPACALLLQDFERHPRVDRIEVGERLIHHDQVGVVQQRRDELRLLLHPAAEVLGLLLPVLVEVEPLQPVGQLDAGRRFGHPLQRRQVDQRGLELEVAVEAALLRHVADAVLGGLVQLLAEQPHLAAVRAEDVEHHADGRRLARAVGAQQAEDFAGVDVEGDIGNGLDRAEALAEAGKLNGR